MLTGSLPAADPPRSGSPARPRSVGDDGARGEHRHHDRRDRTGGRPAGCLSSTAAARPSDKGRATPPPGVPDPRASDRETPRRCQDASRRVCRSPAGRGSHRAGADSLSRPEPERTALGHGDARPPHGRGGPLPADPSGGPPLTSITRTEIFRASSSSSISASCRSSSRGLPGQRAYGWGCVSPVPNQNTT